MIHERFDCSLGTGLGKVKGRMFRIGHLGDCNDLTLMAALAGVRDGPEARRRDSWPAAACRPRWITSPRIRRASAAAERPREAAQTQHRRQPCNDVRFFVPPAPPPAATRRARAARPDSWPTGPVRIVVGFPPGGGTDALARVVGQSSRAMWNQQVIVENKAGVAGVLAAEYVASSRATAPRC